MVYIERLDSILGRDNHLRDLAEELTDTLCLFKEKQSDRPELEYIQAVGSGALDMNADETGLRIIIALDIPSEMFARLPKEYRGEKIHYERVKMVV